MGCFRRGTTCRARFIPQFQCDCTYTINLAVLSLTLTRFRLCGKCGISRPSRPEPGRPNRLAYGILLVPHAVIPHHPPKIGVDKCTLTRRTPVLRSCWISPSSLASPVTTSPTDDTAAPSLLTRSAVFAPPVSRRWCTMRLCAAADRTRSRRAAVICRFQGIIFYNSDASPVNLSWELPPEAQWYGGLQGHLHGDEQLSVL